MHKTRSRYRRNTPRDASSSSANPYQSTLTHSRHSRRRETEREEGGRERGREKIEFTGATELRPEMIWRFINSSRRFSSCHRLIPRIKAKDMRDGCCRARAAREIPPVVPDRAAPLGMSRPRLSVLNQGWLTDAGQSAWNLRVTCPRRLSRLLNHRPRPPPILCLSATHTEPLLCADNLPRSRTPVLCTGRTTQVPHPALSSSSTLSPSLLLV